MYFLVEKNLNRVKVDPVNLTGSKTTLTAVKNIVPLKQFKTTFFKNKY